jgi:hypothetical protein
MDAAKKRAQRLEAKGKPVDFKTLLRMEPDGGTTNIRNVNNPHWKRWRGPDRRLCVPKIKPARSDGEVRPRWRANL